MGKEISLFSGYDQVENRTTNYCLLILRMLYQESPKLLAQALANLLGEQSGLQVGVQFRQQVVKGNSIPDGLISQPAFSIYIEAKLWDWHYDEQLERHLESLYNETPGVKILLALAKFEGNYEERFAPIEKICTEKYNGEIKFLAASYEGFLEAIRLPTLTPSLSTLVDDFELYLNENSLLSNWRGWLDVVNCGAFFEKLIETGVYVCLTTGGPYKHGRCEYLGMYWWKSVRRVATILGVVDVDAIKEGEANILWNNTAQGEISDEKLIELARQRFYNAYPDKDWIGRVFVLGPLIETDFQKDSRGGMLGSKQYFDVKKLKADSIEDLAKKLKKYDWSSINNN